MASRAATAEIARVSPAGRCQWRRPRAEPCRLRGFQPRRRGASMSGRGACSRRLPARAMTRPRHAVSAVPRLCSISRISSTMSRSATPSLRAPRARRRARRRSAARRTNARARSGQIDLRRRPRSWPRGAAGRRPRPAGRPRACASPRRRKMSAAATPSCAYWMPMRKTSSACSLSPRLHAGGAEEAEALGDERARVGREHLPLGRAEEDGERGRPARRGAG